MNNLHITLLLCICISPISTSAEESSPTNTLQKSELVGYIDSIARGNAAAARVNVILDASNRRVRMYSITPTVSHKFDASGYSMEVVYDANLSALAKVGIVAYTYQHNCYVLTFAAAQYAAGKKAFGIKVVECLAEAQPDLFWSSPTHSAMRIHEILMAMEKKDDKAIKDFLDDQSTEWKRKN